MRTNHFGNVATWHSEHAVAFSFPSEMSVLWFLRRYQLVLIGVSSLSAVLATVLYFTGHVPRWRADESPFERPVIAGVATWLAIVCVATVVISLLRMFRHTRLVVSPSTFRLEKFFAGIRTANITGDTGSHVIASDHYTHVEQRRSLGRWVVDRKTSRYRLVLQSRDGVVTRATFGHGLSRTQRMLIRTTFSRMASGKRLEWPPSVRPWRHLSAPAWFPSEQGLG